MLGADELRLFIEAAKTLNMTRAAERVGLSQPALSQSIQRMERQLGMTLFLRSKKGLRLTKTGERLFERGEGLVREWENLHRILTAEGESIAGLVRLGCHQSVALYALPMFLPTMQARFPDIDLQMKHGLSRHVAEDLISGRLDAGIVVNPPAHPDLVIKEILKDEVTVWVKSRKKVPEVLLWDPQLLQSQWLVRELEKRKIHYQRRIETSSLELIRELTAQGCGVGVMPGRVAQISAGLERMHPEVPGFKDRICLVYRADTEKTPTFRAFLSLF